MTFGGELAASSAVPESPMPVDSAHPTVSTSNAGQLIGRGSELASAATAASSRSSHNDTAGCAGEGEGSAVRLGLAVTLAEAPTVGALMELGLSEFVPLAEAVSLLVVEAVSELDGDRDAAADW
jgi:hypothetical protein